MDIEGLQERNSNSVNIWFLDSSLHVGECDVVRIYLPGPLSESATCDVRLSAGSGLYLDAGCTLRGLNWKGLTGRSWYSKDYPVYACDNGFSTGTIQAELWLGTSWLYTAAESANITDIPTPTPTPTPIPHPDIPRPTPYVVDPSNLPEPGLRISCPGARRPHTPNDGVKAQMLLGNVKHSARAAMYRFGPITVPKAKGHFWCARAVVASATDTEVDIRVSGNLFQGTETEIGVLSDSGQENCWSDTQCLWESKTLLNLSSSSDLYVYAKGTHRLTSGSQVESVFTGGGFAIKLGNGPYADPPD